MSATVVGVLLFGCTAADTSTTTENASDIAGNVLVDTAPLPEVVEVPDVGQGELPVTIDAAPTKETSSDPCAVPPFGPRCPCNAPGEWENDCEEGLCIPTDFGSFCSPAPYCFAQCPSGWNCALWQGDPDPVFDCSYEHVSLCAPCASDADCRTGPNGPAHDSRCVVSGDEAYCGAPCSSACLPGFTCADVMTTTGETAEQCVPDTWSGGACSCTPWAVANGASMACQLANEFGVCSGQRTCTESGLDSCDAAPAVAESCDGLDNDCDGDTDEGCPFIPGSCSELTGMCPSAPPECSQIGGIGGPESGQWTPAIASGLGLSDLNTWSDAANTIDELAAEPGVTEVTLDTVLGDLNRQAVVSSDVPNVACEHSAIRWNSGDASVDYWMPQGITGSGHQGSSGTVGGKRMVAVSWYHKTENDESTTVNKGVRISLVDVTANDALTYRHLLLVEPVAGTPADFKAVPIHAGGIAWVGNFLYVADTSKGFRVFDLERPLQVSTGDKNAIGRSPDGSYHAHGYRYVLMQVSRYALCAESCCARFSFAALDPLSDPPRMLAGEYSKSSTFGRLHAWDVSPSSGRLEETGTNFVPVRGVWFTGQNKMQGGLTIDGAPVVASSSQIGKYGALYTAPAGAWAQTPWVEGIEDLYVDASQSPARLWSLSEFPDKRWIISADASAVLGGCSE